MPKHASMSSNSVSQSIINSDIQVSSMTVSRKMSSLIDLSAVSSKISKWFEMGGVNIESVEYFEKSVGLSSEEIIRTEANRTCAEQIVDL